MADVRILYQKPLTVDGVMYIIAAGPSTATKPSERIAAGSEYRETDTGKTYRYDETSGAWTEVSGGSGGGSGSCVYGMDDWSTTGL